MGFFYSAITGYLGFEVNEGEYKVMGLAPYGEPRYADQLRRLIGVLPAGQYRLNMKYFAFLDRGLHVQPGAAPTFSASRRGRPESEILPFHMDVARSVQVVLEEILLEKLRYLH